MAARPPWPGPDATADELAAWHAALRLHRDQDRLRRAGRDKVRKPPRPPYERQPGRCALCGEPPQGRRRTWCSEDCVRLWFTATNPSTALGDLAAVFGWTCWACARPAGHLEVDHVRPLWSLSEVERTQLRWWLPFNLQLLCQTCHRDKTSFEAGVRARRSAWTPALSWPGPGIRLAL